MNEQREATPAERSRRQVRPTRRRQSSVFGVVGELILTAGVLVLLFIGWQQWFNDLVVGGSQQEAGLALSEQWAVPGSGALDPSGVPVSPASSAEPDDSPEPDSGDDPVASAEKPPVLDISTTGDPFAVLIIPRFGEDFARTIVSGVGKEVLSGSSSGVGHYSGTNSPGELGNFALAAHRTTYGRSFHDIDTLVTGDHIFVETADGWYRYVYRNSEYVLPSRVSVLAPLPQFDDVTPGERVLTMTSCNPIYSAAERIIAYAVMDAWFPRSGGAPAELSPPQSNGLSG